MKGTEDYSGFCGLHSGLPRHESALRPIPCKLDISEFAPRLDLGELLKDLLRVDPHKHQASGLVQKRLAVLGMSRALLKLSGSLVHDYATISDDSPSPNRASRARRAATSAGIS